MSLVDNTIWWQTFPLGACGAPIRMREGDDSGHRLNRLLPWLDYVVELGCNGLLLGPIFESVSHGYDTLDHFSVDRRLGDDADFAKLIEQCNERGIRVMLDGVFNHISRSHPRVRELAARNPDGSLVSWEGHDELVTLDHSNRGVVELVAEIMKYWLGRGISGWRLDVAYAVPPQFWREVTKIVRKDFPDALFLGEVIHGEYAEIIEESTLDTLTQYELWKGIWSSISTENFWELAWSLKRHEEFSQDFVPQTFIGNHDVERIATQVGEAGAVLGATALMTLPGMPSIYYGDEQAFQGRKLEGFGADDELRPPLPERPEDLAPVGKWMENIYKGLISIRRQNPWIARGKTCVDGKENEWIEYTVSPRADDTGRGEIVSDTGENEAGRGDGTNSSCLHVRLQVQPKVEARVTDESGKQLFAWGE